MAAKDAENLYSLPYDRLPEFNNYEELVNKPKINGVTIVGNLNTEDLNINIPTKTSELVNDSNFAITSQLPTKTSDLVNDSNFTTRSYVDSTFATKSELPTKVSDLTNDSNFIDKDYVDNAIDVLDTKIEKCDGIIAVKNFLLEESFSCTFDDLESTLATKYAAIKSNLLSGEFVELKTLKINTIGNLKPTSTAIINTTANLESLVIDWQGFVYINNAIKAIDIAGKKVLSLSISNDINDDSYVSYLNDNDTYTFTIEYTKYKTIDLS